MTRQERPDARLFVRLEPKAGLEVRKEQAVEQLRSLSGRGAISDYDVLAWGEAIRPDGPLEEASHCQRLREHVAELRKWIDDNDVSNCGFDARRVVSRMTGESYRVVSLPALCLGIYKNGDLVDVYPRRDGGTFESIDDGLAALTGQPVQATGNPRGND